jgi:GxxExxY protein
MMSLLRWAATLSGSAGTTQRRGAEAREKREIRDERSLNRISGIIVDAAIHVHRALGPGLLESAYEVCLTYELRERGLRVRTQVELPIAYKNVQLETGYRIDLLVEEAVVVELKTVTKVLPVHEAQLLTHLRLSRHRLGLLLNFYVPAMRDGIRRMVNGL